MMARLSLSPFTHERQLESPKPMAPSVRRDTLSPERPRFRFSMSAFRPPTSGMEKAALFLPHFSEARDLVRNPLEVLHGVAHCSVLDREEERHHGYILGNDLLRVA